MAHRGSRGIAVTIPPAVLSRADLVIERDGSRCPAYRAPVRRLDEPGCAIGPSPGRFSPPEAGREEFPRWTR